MWLLYSDVIIKKTSNLCDPCSLLRVSAANVVDPYASSTGNRRIYSLTTQGIDTIYQLKITFDLII